jgi:hypothetical protein
MLKICIYIRSQFQIAVQAVWFTFWMTTRNANSFLNFDVTNAPSSMTIAKPYHKLVLLMQCSPILCYFVTFMFNSLLTSGAWSLLFVVYLTTRPLAQSQIELVWECGRK